MQLCKTLFHRQKIVTEKSIKRNKGFEFQQLDIHSQNKKKQS